MNASPAFASDRARPRGATARPRSRRVARRALLSPNSNEEPPPKGEVTIIVGPPPEQQADLARIDALLDKALPFMPVRAASELIAEALQLPRKEIYRRALEIKDDDG